MTVNFLTESSCIVYRGQTQIAQNFLIHPTPHLYFAVAFDITL